MKKNIAAAVAAGAVAAIIIGISVLTTESQETPQQSKYDELNSLLRQSLDTHRISMSSPIKLVKQDSIEKYCTFFTDPTKQSLIDYCTSTEILDSQQNFLGNIHMVGTPEEPHLILAIVQADPFMTQLNSLKTVFRTTIESAVCKCWYIEKPDGFDSVDSWIDGMKEFHTNDVKPHSKSKIMTLENHKLQIELTTNTDGYLWTLLVER